MAGTIIYMLEVAHVFQRRFDSESLEQALSGSHLYLISRRPSVRIDHASVRVDVHSISFEAVTRRVARGKLENHRFIFKTDDEVIVEDFRTYLDGAYFSFRANGHLVHGDSWALASLASNAREDLARQEVMYIGQAFGRHGATNVIERTRRHETLQRIYEQHAGEQWDVFVSPLIVDQTYKINDDHIDDDECGLEINAFMNDGVIAEQESGRPLAPAIDLIEHSLIEFFRPPYNQKLVTWNPKSPTQAMKLFRSLRFRLVIAQLGGWQGLARFHSDAQPRLQRSHVIAHELVTSDQGIDGRINYDDGSDNWRHKFILGMPNAVARDVEQSGVALLIFGDSAPRVRRPPDVLLPDSTRKIDYEKMVEDNKMVPDFVRYSGPSLDPTTGKVRVGEGAGNVPVYWRLFRPGVGLCNGLIAGPSGIGKTNCLRILAVDIVGSGFLGFYYADPLGRHNERFLTEEAYGAARTWDESVEQLRAGNRLIDSRKAAGEYAGPSSSDAGVFYLVEDAHLVFSHSNEAALLAERIATEGNSVGVSLIVTVPDFNIARFGDRPALREALRKDNQAAFGGDDAFEMFSEGAD
jgi:hypothetical protein